MNINGFSGEIYNIDQVINSRRGKANGVSSLNSNVKIIEAELPDTIVTNPYVGTLKVSNLETDEYKSINVELQKVDNIQASTQAPNITNIAGLTKSTEIATNRVYDIAQSWFCY